MIARLTLASAMLCATAAGGIRSGKAVVDWRAACPVKRKSISISPPEQSCHRPIHKISARPSANSPAILKTPCGLKSPRKTSISSFQSDTALNPDGREFFPATPDGIDPRVPIRFVKNGGAWTAEATKSEFASGPVKRPTLVLAPDKNHEALELTWNAP